MLVSTVPLTKTLVNWIFNCSTKIFYALGFGKPLVRMASVCVLWTPDLECKRQALNCGTRKQEGGWVPMLAINYHILHTSTLLYYRNRNQECFHNFLEVTREQSPRWDMGPQRDDGIGLCHQRLDMFQIAYQK